MNVRTEADTLVAVCVNADTRIVQVLADDAVITLFDLLDPDVLENGSLIEAFGDTDPVPVGCELVADLVIVEPPAP